jgi:phenylacetic acid degradation operon negative regulatory protein
VGSRVLAATNARSVVFDLFGDYIRYTGGAIGLAPLCELLAPFGVSPEAARTVMTRLRSEGWFDSEKDGRKVSYSLSTRALSMLDEGRDRIFTRDTSPWDGLWHLAIYQVPEQQRKTRDVLRKRLAFLGYGSLAPATWISARDHSPQVNSLVDSLGTAEPRLQMTQMVARTSGLEADRDLAHRCWQLEELNWQYKRWLSEWSQTMKKVRAKKLSGPAALVTRVTLVRSFRSFPFSDPELPPDLLPKPWHGLDAYLAFMSAHQLLENEANAWFCSNFSDATECGSRMTMDLVGRSARPVA